MLAHLSFALNYQLHGLDFTGYHLVNLLTHLANALLVYALVALTFRTPFFTRQPARENGLVVAEPRGREAVALFSALLFVAHPVQTQAVTYVCQRFASLATLFYLLSLVACVRSTRLSGARGGHALYAGSLACAVLAMLSKEIAFTRPVV